MLIEKQKLLCDPERQYVSPAKVVEDPDIAERDKLAILRNWKLDLIELLQASNENMASANVPPGTVSEKLREVAQAIEDLESRRLDRQQSVAP